VIGLLAVGGWFGHGPLIEWGLAAVIGHFAPKIGMRVEIGDLHARAFDPVEFRDVRLRMVRPVTSKSDVRIGRIALSMNSLWEIFAGDGRIFARCEADKIDGTFDFRPEGMPPIPIFEFTRERNEEIAAIVLRFIPKAVSVRAGNPVFLGINQSYTVRGLRGDFNEAAVGSLAFDSAWIQAGSIRREIPAAEAATAFKDGAAYVSGLRVSPDIVLRNFVSNFVNPGGIMLTWDLDAFGGSIRGDVAFGARNHLIAIDAGVYLVNVPVEPVPALAALPVSASGVIRDGRLTIRGNPERILDAEIAFRLSASDFRWNDRGWESLVIGGNFIGRKLYLSNFNLTQAENTISANGEMAFPESVAGLSAANFFMNVSADVRDLRALGALAGPAFESLSGQLSLHGSLSGSKGAIDGYLNGAASAVTYRGIPASSAKLSAIARNDEVEVRYAEIWSGDDRIALKGTIGMSRPHHYTGDLTAHIDDLARYTPLAGGAVASNVLTGAADIQWQGDGSASAHSGAFRVALKNVITHLTPTGITGDLAGTYSPNNMYFGTVRLEHGGLDLGSRITLSASGVNIADLELLRNGKTLLRGGGFLPLNVFALAAGRPPAETIDLATPVYAELWSSELPLADLIELAGQKAKVAGSVRLKLVASGPLPALALSGKLTGAHLSAAVEGFSVPATSIDVDLGSADGKAKLDGSIVTRGFQPVKLAAEMPFAFEQTGDGGIRLFKSDAPVAARLEFPKTSVEMLRPFLPKARQLQGTLSGDVSVAGTLRDPRIAGRAEISGGDLDLGPELPRVSAINGIARFDLSKVTLESLRGEVGAGPFEASGSLNFAGGGAPRIDLRLKGSKILLARDPGLRLRADVDLAASGSGAAGAVTGSIALVDGRILRKLEITPLLVPDPIEKPDYVAPRFSGLVPEPYAGWKLDVAVRNATPFLIVGNVATGEISPELALRGTLGNPCPEGTVHLKNVLAYLPASTLRVPEGRIYFTGKNPFMPVMDVRGRAETSGYNIQMYAYGALTESNLALRSDPPLSRENLIRLLTTGLAPVGLSGAGLGEVAAGQGGVLLLRSLARQVEPLGIDLNAFVDRLNVGVVPPADASQSSAIVSELKLSDGFSLTSGRDGYGFYNAGVQYTIRLR
jgi:hypothetical protein